MRDLTNEIREAFSREDSLDPLSDREVARRLGLSRASVTLLRSRLGIMSARDRRRSALADLIKDGRYGGDASLREITRYLAQKGAKVNHSTVSHILMDLRTQQGREVGPVQPNTHPKALSDTAAERGPGGADPLAQDCDPGIHAVFRSLVGAEGSLKPVIQLAQAAVMYPPNGLNTLILGPTGAGKTELAADMHRYAEEIGTVPRGAPFVSMNCADYADNPQLLMAQLFGHAKGAFTGATEDRPGLVELADGGVLFLDEIHRLPPQGQEMLYGIIDRGMFRRLGESQTQRRASFLLIGATSSDPDLALLDATRRRLPVVIRIPPLAQRPPHERLQMLKQFFSDESRKINSRVGVDSNVMQALLRYDCPGNVGQLKADVQVACARGYLRYTAGRAKTVRVILEDLPPYAAKGLMESRSGLLGFSAYLRESVVFEPVSGAEENRPLQDAYAFPENLYEWMEERYRQLKASGHNQVRRTEIVAGELEQMIVNQLRAVHVGGETWQAVELSRHADPKVLEAVHAALSAEFDEASSDESLIACVAIHLTASLERKRQGGEMLNPGDFLGASNIPAPIFAKAERALRRVEQSLGVAFPDYESSFIAMYARSRQDRSRSAGQKIGIVLASHGRVASAVRDVVDVLLPGANIHLLEIDLRETLKEAFSRAERVIGQAHRGFGVVMVADMGSLLTFGQMISEKAGVPVRTISPLTTVVALDLARHAMSGCTLDETCRQVEEDLAALSGRGIEQRSVAPPAAVKATPNESVVLVACITGKGLADRLAGLLKDYLGGEGSADFIPVSISAAPIVFARHRPNVVAIVGPIDPCVPGATYIAMDSLQSGDGIERLRRLLSGERGLGGDGRHGPGIGQALSRDRVLLDVEGGDRYELIRRLSSVLEQEGSVSAEFAESAVQREMLFPTFIGRGLAIPHGSPSEVLRSSVVAARLGQPCDWGGNPVRLVFLLALKSDGVSVVEELQKAIETHEVVRALVDATDRDEFVHTVVSAAGAKEGEVGCDRFLRPEPGSGRR